MAYVVVNKPTPDAEVLKVMAQDLASRFSEEQIDDAIAQVMRECEWVTLKAIIERIPGGADGDGRPGPEEAWANCPRSEELSVVWTEEMEAAFGVARSLLQDGDEIGARMAFKEVYPKLVASARTERRPARWIVSLGWDPADRLRTLIEAVRNGRVTARGALAKLGPEQRDELLAVLPPPERKMLEGEVGPHGRDLGQLVGLKRVIAEMADSKQLPPEIVEQRPQFTQTEDERVEHVRRTRAWAARVRETEERRLP